MAHPAQFQQTAPPPILYHYCTANTFVSIISGQSVWLSSLSMSNDTLEGRSLHTLVDKLAESEGLPERRRAHLVEASKDLNLMFDGLALCLSEEGDLLSQWRGYADDGHGFAIGFDSSFLLRLVEQVSGLQTMLTRVTYSEKEQLEACRPIYDKFARFAADGTLDNLPRPSSLLIENPDYDDQLKAYKGAELLLRISATQLLEALYAMKTPSFQEEKEWRIISHWMPEMPVVDGIRYRSSRDRIIPYLPVAFSKDLLPKAVREVVIGPKNISPNSHINALLKQHQFTEATIFRSAATYR